jgi:hypothetical protein
MNTLNKTIHCRLLNLKGKYVSDVVTQISLIMPEDQSQKPCYSIYVEENGYEPDLDNKNYLLELKESVKGKVFISIANKVLPNMDRTIFDVNLQDDIWNNLDWFKELT